MPHTLLTGANSFVGAHVINSLLAAGHTVTGTVRRDGLAEQILGLHPEWNGKVDIVVVRDYEEESLWDEVFKQRTFDHIIHTAAPLLDDPAKNDYDRDFLLTTVNGNIALLTSALNHAPTLKSVAVTGSVNALTTGFAEELLAGPITNDTWLAMTQEEARASNNPYFWYCSAKKEGERAIWKFVEEKKPAFGVTVFLPALIFGPPIQPVKSVNKLNYSTSIIYSFFNGTYESIPSTSFPFYIDARDLADAHVKSLTEEKARNRRLLVGGAPMTYTKLVRALAKVPELAGRLPAESGEDEKVVSGKLDSAEGDALLSMTFRTLEQTMADTARQILAMEEKEKASA